MTHSRKAGTWASSTRREGVVSSQFDKSNVADLENEQRQHYYKLTLRAENMHGKYLRTQIAATKKSPVCSVSQAQQG